MYGFRAILISVTFPLAMISVNISTMAGPATAGKCTPLPDEKIGVQMYSMNSVLRDPNPAPGGGARGGGARGGTPPAIVDSVLAGLHTIGYKNAELAGLFGQPIGTVRPLMEKNQIRVIGNHGNFTNDMTVWAQTIADAQALGQAPMIGSAGYGPPGLNGGIDNVLATAANLNRLGEAAAAKGLSLYMHNHTAEITTTYPYDIKKNGKPEPVSALEIVAANTDPRYVHFEIDVHWALDAYKNNQDDMIAFLNRLRGRIIALHVKDTSPDGKITDVGAGIIDWPRVYAAAGPDVKYYIWEYDGAPNPMKNAEIAYKYMRCIP
jgi:sugar phosphate isomerase/epimerase